MGAKRHSPGSPGWNIMQKFKRLYDQELAERNKREAMRATWEEERRASKDERARFLSGCRPATATDYADWLIGHMESGGNPTHLYDYDLAHRGFTVNGSIGNGTCSVQEGPIQWWVLERMNGPIPSLYGAKSINVIVPERSPLTPEWIPDTFHGRAGHSGFYFMSGFVAVAATIPVYLDVFTVIAEQFGWAQDMGQWVIDVPEIESKRHKG